MANLRDHRLGDTWLGHLWAFDDAQRVPKNISAWAFFLDFRAAEGIAGEPAWTLSTANGGLVRLDGDGRTVQLHSCGQHPRKSRVLAAVGYHYLVEVVPVVPELAGGTWWWRLRAVDPGSGGPEIRLTLDTGRWTLTT